MNKSVLKCDGANTAANKQRKVYEVNWVKGLSTQKWYATVDSHNYVALTQARSYLNIRTWARFEPPTSSLVRRINDALEP